MLRSLAHHTTCILALCALATGCNDVGSNADTSSTESGTTESGATESGDTSTDTMNPDTSDTQSEWETGGPEEEDTAEDEAETGDPDPVCEAEQALGDWGLMLVDGDFPNDVPTDVDETCTVISGAADQLALDCPFGEFALILGLTPAPTLPEVGATAQVRIHHEGGWQNWPDLWVSVDVVDGDLFAMQASSVLLPLQGSFTVPWDPAEAGTECGPFDLLDSCGPQVGKELAFTVDGEEVSGWHGTHTLTTVADLEFEAWINLAREYTSPPETCDFSPTFYSVVTRRQRTE
jgi:hypothetical protein